MVSVASTGRILDELEIQYSFIAVRPFDAEHPIGSGKVVHYEPGDVAPAGDWGSAAYSMMEMGKIERLAVNVESLGEALVEENETADDAEYPVHIGAGWYLLSSGERIRTKALAEQAQKDLGDKS